MPRIRSRSSPSRRRSSVISGSRATVSEPSLTTFRFAFSVRTISTPSGVSSKRLPSRSTETVSPPSSARISRADSAAMRAAALFIALPRLLPSTR